MVDYRKFRLSKLSGEFGYLKLLLWWPAFGLAFSFVEKFYPVKDYHAVYSPLDDLIPFNEAFVIPYLYWFIAIAGMLIYTLLFDVPSFKKMMYFTMLTYTFTLIVYLIYPTCQELRPAAFERDNMLTRFMADFYNFDTSTNVCPSIHVIGAFAVFFASFNTERFKTPLWRIYFFVTTMLICLSTVFLKQHSVLDVFWALPVCAAGYFIVYVLKIKKRCSETETITT